MPDDQHFQNGQAQSRPLRIALRILRTELSDRLPDEARTDREVYEALSDEYDDLIRLAREYGSL